MEQITLIPVEKIVAGLNDRTVFNRAELEQLAAHIAEHGLIQPPKYRTRPGGMYQILCGERRTRAMRDILGRTEIPAIVIDCDDEQAFIIMAGENRNRVQLNPIEDAQGIARGIADFGYTVARAAETMGKSTSYIRDRLALLKLCTEAQELVSKGQLTLGLAGVLAHFAGEGLNRDYQNVALDALKRNPAPSEAWFRGICANLLGKQAEHTMFNLADFMQANVGTPDAAGAVTLPPHPETDSAPVDGSDPQAILTAQAAWWEQAAESWALLAHKGEARACRQQAKTLRQTATLLASLPAPAPVAPEAPKYEAPPAPTALPDNVSPLRLKHTCDDCGARQVAVWQVSTVEYHHGAKQLKMQTICAGCATARGIAGIPAQRDLWAS